MTDQPKVHLSFSDQVGDTSISSFFRIARLEKELADARAHAPTKATVALSIACAFASGGTLAAVLSDTTSSEWCSGLWASWSATARIFWGRAVVTLATLGVIGRVGLSLFVGFVGCVALSTFTGVVTAPTEIRIETADDLSGTYPNPFVGGTHQDAIVTGDDLVGVYPGGVGPTALATHNLLLRNGLQPEWRTKDGTVYMSAGGRRVGDTACPGVPLSGGIFVDFDGSLYVCASQCRETAILTFDSNGAPSKLWLRSCAGGGGGGGR